MYRLLPQPFGLQTLFLFYSTNTSAGVLSNCWFLLFGNPLLFLEKALTEAIGFSNELQDTRFMGQAVKKGRCHFLVPKNLIPFPKTEVRGHDDRDPFVSIAAYLKQ